MKTTREKIVREALKSFLTIGYENTSISYLADCVNVTKPAIYYHFKDKQDILLNTCRFLMNSIDEEYVRLFQQENSLEVILKRMFYSVKDVQKKFGEITGFKTDKFNYHRFFFDCIKYLPSSSLIEEHYQKHSSLLFTRIKHAQENHQISSVLDFEAFAFQVLATLEGAHLLSLYLPELRMEDLTKKMFSNLEQLLFIKDNEVDIKPS
ncbi:MAG: TetR/AcrR family transcriptional regulator [Candidatus Hodarchaeales archaeon]|jgi:AcrR family transcriptional regulator